MSPALRCSLTFSFFKKSTRWPSWLTCLTLSSLKPFIWLLCEFLAFLFVQKVQCLHLCNFRCWAFHSRVSLWSWMLLQVRESHPHTQYMSLSTLFITAHFSTSWILSTISLTEQLKKMWLHWLRRWNDQWMTFQREMSWTWFYDKDDFIADFFVDHILYRIRNSWESETIIVFDFAHFVNGIGLPESTIMTSSCPLSGISYIWCIHDVRYPDITCCWFPAEQFNTRFPGDWLESQSESRRLFLDSPVLSGKWFLKEEVHLTPSWLSRKSWCMYYRGEVFFILQVKIESEMTNESRESRLLTTREKKLFIINYQFWQTWQTWISQMYLLWDRVIISSLQSCPDLAVTRVTNPMSRLDSLSARLRRNNSLNREWWWCYPEWLFPSYTERAFFA